MLRITKSILSSENVRAEPRKGHGAFKLDFWKATRFRHGLPTDFGKVKRDCLRRLHLTSDKVNADQDIREGQGISKKPHGAFMHLCNLSLRLISLARFRLIPSVSEGYIPRIPPRSSTRRTITKKMHH